jgi:hypothetical protein
MKKLMGVMMAFGLVLAVACNKEEGKPAPAAGDKAAAPAKTDTAAKPADKAAGDKAAAPAGDKAAAPAGDKAAAPAAAGGDIGVAECDEYIKKMSDCSGKLQPEAAGPMKESMETMKKAWKDAAATPEGKTALASGCKQALDAAKSAYASMGCSF